MGTKPLIAPKRNIEAGKTVIVEKKRYKRGSIQKLNLKKNTTNKQNTDEKKTIRKNEKSKLKINLVLYLNLYQKMNKKEF